MNEALKEQISALMDGEASDEERALLIKRVARDGESLGVWSDYHRISDVLHGGVESQAQPGFPASVMAALEGVAPDDVNPPAGAALESSPGHGSERVGRGWGSLALAASVGALAFALVFQLARDPQPVETPQLAQASQVQAPQSQPPQSQTPQARTASAVIDATPATATPDVAVAVRELPDITPLGIQATGGTSEPTRRLSAYMVEHNQHAVFTGGRGAMPYARIAGAAAIYDR
ncbi:MAG: RseA family anti-sigma factor [Gammaproteobacteria bacterium]